MNAKEKNSKNRIKCVKYYLPIVHRHKTVTYTLFAKIKVPLYQNRKSEIKYSYKNKMAQQGVKKIPYQVVIDSDGEPVDECEKCYQDIVQGQDIVCCEGMCARKFHISCVGISMAAAELVVSCINISFVCSNCFVLTPKGLNTDMKDLAKRITNNEGKLQKNTDEILRKQENLNSSIKLYMKDILEDVQSNRKSLENITKAMKTLFQSCSEDKQTLAKITSYLKEDGSSVALGNNKCDKVDTVDERTSNICLDKKFEDFSATLESMTEVTTNLIEIGLQRYQELIILISEVSAKVKVKSRRYRKVKSSLRKHLKASKKVTWEDFQPQKGNQKSAAKKSNGSEDPKGQMVLASDTVRSEEERIGDLCSSIQTTENSIISHLKKEIVSDRTSKKDARSQEVVQHNRTGKKRKNKNHGKGQKEKVQILSNELVSKKDSAINLQIYEYNQTVRKYMEYERNMVKCQEPERSKSLNIRLDRRLAGPRIQIVGIRDSMTGIELIEKLVQQNDIRHETDIKVISTVNSKIVRGKNKFKAFNTIIEVNGNDHKSLIQEGKVNLGFNRYRVIDAIDVECTETVAVYA